MSDRLSPSDARDPFVARALATLPIPEHAPDFWDRLEVALDAVSLDAASLDTAPDEPSRAPLAVIIAPHEIAGSWPQHIDLTEVIRPGGERVRGRSRFSRAARPLLAAAAVVLVIAAVRVSVADDDGDGDALLQATTVSGAEASRPQTSGPQTSADPSRLGSTTTAIVGDAQRATMTLNSFLKALGNGRPADAAKLIGPRSETYLTSQSGSVQAFLIEASEGFGAWAFSTDRVFTPVEVAPGSMVIVIEGTVAAEGENERRIEAFPMTKAESANAWFVDMWAFDPAIGGRIELAAAPSRNGVRELRVGEPFEVFADAPGTVRFVLAGRAPVEVATVKRAGANVATWTPTAADIEAEADADKDRMLTVAYSSDSGTIFTAIATRGRVS